MGKKRSVPEQVELLIKQTLKTKVWSKNKFVSCDKDAGHLATKILKASKQTKFVDSEGNLNEDGQAWIEKHSGACVKALNDLRNEVTSGMQAEWKNYYTEHGKLPTIEEFTDVVMRKGNADANLFKFYWDNILPKAVGAKLFNEEKKYHGAPSTLCVDKRFVVSPQKPIFPQPLCHASGACLLLFCLCAAM